jgi:hypothetical protein
VATTKSRSDGATGGVFGRAGVVFVLVLAGCKASRPVPASMLDAGPALPSVPTGLLATISVPSPRALYAGVRALGGSRARALPASPELTLAAGLGLPARIAGALEFDRPLAGAILASDVGAPSVVIACRVRSGNELVLALSGGTKPEWRAVREANSGLTVLTASDGSAFGVIGDWLVLASAPGELASAGPYVARVLGARPPAETAVRIEVAGSAFDGLAGALRARWAASRASSALLAARTQADAGRPADFADPEAILRVADGAVASLGELVASSRAAVVTLSLGSARAELALEVEPTPGGAADAATRRLVTGPLDPLLGLPKSSVLGVLMRARTAEPGVAAADGAGPLAEVLGPRLSEKDRASFGEALSLAERGLGETTSLALLPDASAVMHSDVGDPDTLERAVPSLLGALRVPALRVPLAPLLGTAEPRVSTAKAPGFDAPIHRLLFAPPRAGASGVELSWGLKGREFWLSASRDSTSTLASLASASPSETLGADAELRAAAARRSSAALAVWADLAGFAGAPASALFVCGKRGGAARIELELSGAVLGPALERLLP